VFVYSVAKKRTQKGPAETNGKKTETYLSIETTAGRPLSIWINGEALFIIGPPSVVIAIFANDYAPSFGGEIISFSASNSPVRLFDARRPDTKRAYTYVYVSIVARLAGHGGIPKSRKPERVRARPCLRETGTDGGGEVVVVVVSAGGFSEGDV